MPDIKQKQKTPIKNFNKKIVYTEKIKEHAVNVKNRTNDFVNQNKNNICDEDFLNKSKENLISNLSEYIKEYENTINFALYNSFALIGCLNVPDLASPGSK